MKEYRIAAIKAFVRYVSVDCPYDDLKASEYLTLSETLRDIPRAFLVPSASLRKQTLYHYAAYLDSPRENPIPASGILSLSASREGMREFMLNCGLDGTLYVVTPRCDAILIDAGKLATALHKKGKLPWEIMRRIQQENEYIYVNPTTDCCKKTTLEQPQT